MISLLFPGTDLIRADAFFQLCKTSIIQLVRLLKQA